jgi:N4-gp56 family major capsid protein
MPNAQATTTNLSQEIAIYYDKVFLDRAQMEQKYNFLAIKKSFPKNSGKTVYFTRQTAMTPKTAALTEGTNPTGTAISAVTVSAVVGEYGDFTEFSSLYSLTTIDAGLKEKIDTLGQNAGESLDTVLRNTMLATSTIQYASASTARTQVSALAASDVLSVVELRKAFNTLYVNKAPKFENGNYRGVISAQGLLELQGDTAAGNWINVNIYNSSENAEMVKKGVIGRLYGFDLVPTNNQYSQSSTVTVYSSFFAGKGAVAEVDLGTGDYELIYNDVASGGTSNPLNMFGTVGYKIKSYASVVLNSSWLIQLYHA